MHRTLRLGAQFPLDCSNQSTMECFTHIDFEVAQRELCKSHTFANFCNFKTMRTVKRGRDHAK